MLLDKILTLSDLKVRHTLLVPVHPNQNSI